MWFYNLTFINCTFNGVGDIFNIHAITFFWRVIFENFTKGSGDFIAGEFYSDLMKLYSWIYFDDNGINVKTLNSDGGCLVRFSENSLYRGDTNNSVQFSNVHLQNMNNLSCLVNISCGELPVAFQNVMLSNVTFINAPIELTNA